MTGVGDPTLLELLEFEAREYELEAGAYGESPASNSLLASAARLRAAAARLRAAWSDAEGWETDGARAERALLHRINNGPLR